MAGYWACGTRQSCACMLHDQPPQQRLPSCLPQGQMADPVKLRDALNVRARVQDKSLTATAAAHLPPISGHTLPVIES